MATDNTEFDLADPWEKLLIPDASKQLELSQVALVKQKLWERYLYSFKPLAEEALGLHDESGQAASFPAGTLPVLHR